MKRVNISVLLANRIEALVLPTSRPGRVGPDHEPYASVSAALPVRSALGRFLTKKGWVNRDLVADFNSYVMLIRTRLVIRSGRDPFVSVMIVSV